MQPKLSYNLDLSEKSEWLTVTAAQAARSSIAYVQELGDFYGGKEYYTTRESLPSFLIKLCLHGKGLLEYRGQRYEILPGQLFWLDCMEPQHYQTAKDADEWRLLWVHCYGSTCAAYFNLFMQQNAGKPVIDIGADSGIRNALERLMDIYRGEGNTLQDDIQASGLLTALMTRCISLAAQPAEAQALPGYVAAARDYIHRSYAERITLDALAKRISINKFYLQKLFKRHMGLSPCEYLTHVRLTQAKRLLRGTNRPVGQIAAEVGIENVGYFINLFKRFEGITPNAYRHRWYQTEMDMGGEGEI